MENEIINNEVMEEVIDTAADTNVTEIVKSVDGMDWKAIGLGAAAAAIVIVGGKFVVKKVIVPAAKWTGRKVKGLLSKKNEPELTEDETETKE